MDFDTFLDIVWQAYLRVGGGGEPPDPQELEAVLAEAERFWLSTARFNLTPGAWPSLSFIGDAYIASLLFGPAAGPTALTRGRDGRLAIRTPLGIEVSMEDYRSDPIEALYGYKRAVYIALYGELPDTDADRWLRGESGGALEVLERAGDVASLSMVLGTAAKTPGQVRAALVDRIVSGQPLTTRAEAQTAYNTYRQSKLAQGYGLEDLDAARDFGDLWEEYSGSYGARLIPLSTTFQDYLETYYNDLLVRPGQVSRTFVQEEATRARQAQGLPETVPLSPALAELLALGFPVGTALAFLKPQRGESYLAYRDRVRRTGLLDQLASLLNQQDDTLLSEMGLIRPQGGFTADDTYEAAVEAGIVASPFTFEDATYQLAGQTFSILVPPAMALEPVVTSNLQDVLKGIEAGRPTEDLTEAILAFARTLPPEQQVEAAEILLAQRKIIELQFALQEPALEQQRAEQQAARAQELEQLKQEASARLRALGEAEPTVFDPTTGLQVPLSQAEIEPGQRAQVTEAFRRQRERETAIAEHREVGGIELFRRGAQPVSARQAFLRSFDFGALVTGELAQRRQQEEERAARQAQQEAAQRQREAQVTAREAERLRREEEEEARRQAEEAARRAAAVPPLLIRRSEV